MICVIADIFVGVAVFQAELNGEIEVDIMVQLLAPLLSSQQFLIEELKTAYVSLSCENGFVFVFAEVGHVAGRTISILL